MIQLILTQTKYRLLLASGLVLLALLSGSLNLSRAAGGETGSRYRPGETPAGLTAAEWAQVTAHIEGAQPAAANPPAQQAYVKASNSGAGDRFYVVALSGDTLAVGSPIEFSSAVGVNPPGGPADNSAPNAGAVYIFTRSGGVWSQQDYLKASNTGAGDFFGSAVALAGDTLAVGASGEASNAMGVNGNQGDNSAQEAGAVYVFTRSGGGWSQQAYLKASNTGVRDRFGSAVALAGDTLAVTAVGEDSNARGINGNQGDNSARDAGAVYVFTRSGSTWSQQAYVKASNTEADDNFGQSVALTGDTLAVGAHAEDSNAVGVNPPGGQADNSAPESGAVYLFTRSGSTWSQQAYLKASNPGGADYFGWAVALAGNTLAVGATGEASSAMGVNPPGGQADNSAFNAGAVYIFTYSGGVWGQRAYLKASNTGGADLFGSAVALAGDTLAVGAPYEASSAVGVNPPGGQADNSAIQAGAVYVFTRSGGVWSQQAYVKASNTEWYDFLGRTVALSGDTLAVGAYGEDSSAVGVNPPGGQADNSAFEAGAAYVLTGFGPPGSNVYLPLVVK